jgi:hypothetical protein
VSSNLMPEFQDKRIFLAAKASINLKDFTITVDGGDLISKEAIDTGEMRSITDRSLHYMAGIRDTRSRLSIEFI